MFFSITSSTSALKFMFYLILIHGAVFVKTQDNTTSRNETESELILTTLINEELIKSESEMKDSRSKAPAPVYENLDPQDRNKLNLKNVSIFETMNSNQVDNRLINKVDSNLNIDKIENSGFKPSTFLGRIGEINFTGTFVNPFLKAHFVGLENESLSLGQQSVSHRIVKFYDTDSGYKPESVKIHVSKKLQNQQSLRSNNQNSHNQFSDSDYSQRTLGHETKIIHGFLSIRPANSENIENLYQNTERPQIYQNSDNQFSQLNVQKPYYLETTTPYQLGFENNVNFPIREKLLQSYAQNYGHVNSHQIDQLQKPEFEFHQFGKPGLDYGQFGRPGTEFNQFGKPETYLNQFKKPDIGGPGFFAGPTNFGKLENPAYLVPQEFVPLKTKQVPYQFQQQTFLTELPLLEQHQSHDCAQKRTRSSLWKKIFHLLGIAIPFGLALAALTPRVVSIDHSNTTEPNIVLAKLRSDNLPIEHREGRISDNLDTCEERSICETILEGAKGKSTFVQSALWNLSKRMSDETAKKNGLQEIFAAVKRKNCGSLTC